jgi:hypothetical protein
MLDCLSCINHAKVGWCKLSWNQRDCDKEDIFYVDADEYFVDKIEDCELD